MIFSFAHAAESSVSTENALKIANLYYRWDITKEKVEELAQWDLLLVDMENQFYTPENLRKIKELNPHIILLAYISPIDIFQTSPVDENNYHNQLLAKIYQHPEWILMEKDGDYARYWKNNIILDITQEEWRKAFVDFVEDTIMQEDIWDGVFYDNLWEGIQFTGADVKITDTEWKNGIRKMLQRTRNVSKPYKNDFLIVGNSGVSHKEYMNGTVFENFPKTAYGGWTDSLKKYFFILENAGYEPALGVINANAQNTGTKDNYQDMRFGLASALLGDGYFSYDDGDDSHEQTWLYDEYSVFLGRAKADAYNALNPGNTDIQESVWRRDFEKGIVLLNSTDQDKKIILEKGFEKILGTQDPEVNNGSIIGSMTIPAHDGILLLGRLDTISGTTFLNGSYAKVWTKKGKEKRKSFFPYRSEFPGGSKILDIPEKNMTIVAFQGKISFYKNDVLRNEIYPYGKNYTEEISMASGALYGGSKYYLVTGAEKYGGQIRIYDLSGNLKDPGCFAFQENNGVFLTLGQMNKKKGLEIIATQASGGKGEIKILNNRCKQIGKSFTAFEKIQSGSSLASGNLDKDSRDEIVIAPKSGGKPLVRVFERNGKLKRSFYAGSKDNTAGLFLGVTDVDGDEKEEIITNSLNIFS